MIPRLGNFWVVSRLRGFEAVQCHKGMSVSHNWWFLPDYLCIVSMLNQLWMDTLGLTESPGGLCNFDDCGRPTDGCIALVTGASGLLGNWRLELDKGQLWIAMVYPTWSILCETCSFARGDVVVVMLRKIHLLVSLFGRNLHVPLHPVHCALNKKAYGRTPWSSVMQFEESKLK